MVGLRVVVIIIITKVEIASVKKTYKYSTLPSGYIFQPVSFESLGPQNASALNSPSEVSRRLSSFSGNSRETSFLIQRLSMLIQRFNSALIMDSFCSSDEDPDMQPPVIFVFSF